tara:strand:+ start:3549 stop:3968 length:420 start_codon:yes stop_codon:yes gene_type:complete
LKFLNPIKSTWRKGFDYKGITTKKDFIDYFIIRFIIWIILTFPFDILLGILNYYQYVVLNYENILTELINVVSQTLTLGKSIFMIGSIVVEIPLTIRCLRNAGKRWQWVFLNIINPFGLLIILLIPLRKSKPTNEIIEK